MEKKKLKKTPIKDHLYKELDTLLLLAPPKQLKKSLHEVYALFLQNIDTTIMRKDFKEIAMDFYFLHHFL
jgi:hypothetical protein